MPYAIMDIAIEGQPTVIGGFFFDLITPYSDYLL